VLYGTGDRVDFHPGEFACAKPDDRASCEPDGDPTLPTKGLELDVVIVFLGCGIECLPCREGESVVVKEPGVLEEMESISFEMCSSSNSIGEAALSPMAATGDLLFNMSSWSLALCRADLR
jgi:hypothetical protein